MAMILATLHNVVSRLKRDNAQRMLHIVPDTPTYVLREWGGSIIIIKDQDN